VIVKRLASIEDFGSMNVICSDKTGTLTEGIVHLQSAVDVEGVPSDKVFVHAYLNAFYETGFTNPIDEAIRASRQVDLTRYQKADEIPYDFLRKRLSILVAHDDTHLMVTKGALANVLAVCALAEIGEGRIVDIATVQDRIQKHLEEFSDKGCRTLGVAYKNMGSESRINKDQETGMTFLGFLVLFDPPKPNIIETIASLKTLGVALKIITGDNHLVAACVSQQMGLSNTKILTGPDLSQLSDGALLRRVVDVDVFAEIEPNQKERIILALKKAGNVVGIWGRHQRCPRSMRRCWYFVESAVDVAKEVADIVLLEKDLGVLLQGVRRADDVPNTLKYVFMATSANFGNMFSMAGVSLFLPFLPLLPTDLAHNLMTDFRDDHRHRRWIAKWLTIRGAGIQGSASSCYFGPVSSIFDTSLWRALPSYAIQDQFRTGWFSSRLQRP
jgi:Mg2+-importing ATPase